ncbi:MAG: response regulator [Opitutae bacterium]|nr:response regulator [Opitutae bacterium]
MTTAHSLDTVTTPGAGRLLLADDDHFFREGLATRLRREGFECVCVASAEAAVAALRSSEFETLLSDIYMPGNTRLELLQDAPQIATGLPIILLTGQPSVETAVKSVKLSVAGYLLKPPEWPELLALVHESVGRYRSYRNIAGSRQRLQQWVHDLQAVEHSLRDTPATHRATPAAQYLQMMTVNLLAVLGEMEATLRQLQQAEKAQTGGREQELLAALEETVAVLLQTRQNFKSKRLGHLRQTLEGLLGNATPAPAAEVPVAGKDFS